MNINQFWNAVINQNKEALIKYFQPNAVIRWHCSNEVFNVKEFICANCEYPGVWNGEIERILNMADSIITVCRVYDDNSSFHVVSFFRIKDDLISELDEYWADDTAPPEWRQAMNIGKKLKG